jgi:hypothetical protein
MRYPACFRGLPILAESGLNPRSGTSEPAYLSRFYSFQGARGTTHGTTHADRCTGGAIRKPPNASEVADRTESLAILSGLAREGRVSAAIALARELRDDEASHDREEEGMTLAQEIFRDAGIEWRE